MRDYRIDLRRDIHSMSWRKFNVLLSNLSSESITRLLTQQEKEESKPEMKTLTQSEFVDLLGT